MSDKKQILVGICAMSKKVKSKPMNEILKGLIKAPYIKLITFDENMILNEPIESWPICDALISFYSQKFPLDKAIQYAELREPYLINDLKFQKLLQNRKSVYELLEKSGIPVPKYICVDRQKEDYNVVELDDAIEINGEIIQKPFVEKPLDAEDHNIYIYFPSTAGGGRQQLFRKIGDRSSKYNSHSSVRREGSFIYETFMPTDGTDVKIYTVGEDYAHAEARKSPALDGKVERDQEGKEVRYPVILSLREKMMAKKVALAFQQQICGFDLLRANGMSYVCDVNGFSFVKSSPKYYEDCSQILLTLITRYIAPHLSSPHAFAPLKDDSNSILVATTSGSIMELRCVIGVIRHGDRTPKQKLKMEVKDERFQELFKKYSSERSKEIKLKKPMQLQEVLDIVREILYNAESDVQYDNLISEQKQKFEQIRNILEMYGHFSGINRKIQMKKKTDTDFNDSALILIVKWGGELTDAGRIQAEKLGRAFRRLYPSGNGNYNDDSGLGLLRLHSTYRHDLKIYASDEGRVQMTAAAFAKGFLALEGELPPILVQMVKSANTNGLLDNDNDCRHYQVLVKKKIFDIMSRNKVLTDEEIGKVAKTKSSSLITALRHIRNPVKTCDLLMHYLINLNLHLNEFTSEERGAISLYHEESWELLLRRWRKLLKDFRPKDTFDLSKISDIYDNIKYDIQHNPMILSEESCAFFMCAKALADVIVPQEYGVTREEKLVIGQRICTPLLRKILCDAKYTDVDECTRLHAGYSKGVASPERFVRTRLYFTSESHLHALLNTIRYGGLTNVDCDKQWKRAMEYVNGVTEMNYLSQIVIMIFEDPRCVSKSAKDRFHVEIHFSPGAFTGFTKPVVGTGYRPKNLERNCNKSFSPNKKSMSRSSSTYEKTDAKNTDDEKDSGCMMRDLWSKISRKKYKFNKKQNNSTSATPISSVTSSVNGDFSGTVSGTDALGPNDTEATAPGSPGSKMDEQQQQKIQSGNSTDSSDGVITTATSTPSCSGGSGVYLDANVTNVSCSEINSRFTVTSVTPLNNMNIVDIDSRSDLSLSGCIYHQPNISPDVCKSRTADNSKSVPRDDDEDIQYMNYLTYPATDVAMTIYYDLSLLSSIERKGSARFISTSRPLISTDVIKGARLYSTGSIPGINTLSGSTKDLTLDDREKEDTLIPCAPCVPDIHSLETLHNALTLNDLESFLNRLVNQKYSTPCESPK